MAAAADAVTESPTMRANVDMPQRLLIAIGGNAIHPAGIRGTSEEQFAFAAEAAGALLPILKTIESLIITHGNGPGVGKVIMRQTIARDRVAPMSLDICVANSQGGIAYVLMQAFENALRHAGSSRQVASLLTQVEVDPQDPAFSKPSKPVGYFFTRQEADALSRELGWRMQEDAGRGWRLVVPSPEPKNICNISLIQALTERGAVVIAGGGGGIPVVCDASGMQHGIDAVIDKDFTSACMARALGIENLMILTGVSRVAVNFGTLKQKDLEHVPISTMRKYMAEGHFSDGSMGPKVEAAVRFLEAGGEHAIIAHLQEALPALRGEAGTHVVRDEP